MRISLQSSLCLFVKRVLDGLSFLRPGFGKGPIGGSHALFDLWLRIVKAFFDRLLCNVETSNMLKVRLRAGLPVQNSGEPICSKCARLYIFILNGEPKVLHDAGVYGYVLKQSLDSVIAVLGGDVFGTSTHFDEVLHVDFDHWIEGRS